MFHIVHAWRPDGATNGMLPRVLVVSGGQVSNVEWWILDDRVSMNGPGPRCTAGTSVANTVRVRIILLVSALTLSFHTVALAQAPGTKAEPVGPQTQYWLDVTGSVFGEHSASAGTRVGTEVVLAAQAEEDGGLFRGILMPWARADAHMRLTAGGPTPGFGGHVAFAARLFDPHGEEDGLYLRFFPLDVEFSREQQVRPALSSRREMWARPYTKTSYGWSVTGGNMTPIKGLEILTMGLTTTHIEQPDELRPLKQARFDIKAHFFAYRRARAEGKPEFLATLLRIGGGGIANAVGPSASVGQVEFLRLEGVPLGPYLNLDIAGGVAGTGSMHISTSSSGRPISEVTIITEELPPVESSIGYARLHGSYGDVAAAVTAERSMYLTVDVELALEDRMTASVRWLRPWGQVSVEGFAARSLLWLDQETSQTSMIGGGHASLRYQLQPDLSLTASLEVARSFLGEIIRGQI